MPMAMRQSLCHTSLKAAGTLRVTAAQSSLRSCQLFGFFSACDGGPPRILMPMYTPMVYRILGYYNTGSVIV